jgi:hypothetical protein
MLLICSYCGYVRVDKTYKVKIDRAGIPWIEPYHIGSTENDLSASHCICADCKADLDKQLEEIKQKQENGRC